MNIIQIIAMTVLPLTLGFIIGYLTSDELLKKKYKIRGKKWE